MTEEKDRMKMVPHASVVGSLMYAMLYNISYIICFVIGMVCRYQSNPSMEHWMVVKHRLKYLQRTRDYLMVYHCNDLLPLGYIDSDFQSNRDSCKSTSTFVFTLGSGVASWRSVE